MTLLDGSVQMSHSGYTCEQSPLVDSSRCTQHIYCVCDANFCYVRSSLTMAYYGRHAAFCKHMGSIIKVTYLILTTSQFYSIPVGMIGISISIRGALSTLQCLCPHASFGHFLTQQLSAEAILISCLSLEHLTIYLASPEVPLIQRGWWASLQSAG